MSNNMKKTIRSYLLPLLLLVATDAEAQEKNLYARVLSGVNFLQNTALNGNRASYQPGYVVSGALGYSWCYGLSLEAEYAYRRNEIKKIRFISQGSSHHGHFRTSSYMANLLWDVPLCSWGYSFWNIQPFIGAGIGYDDQRMRASNSLVVFNQKWDHFSWQLMAGLAYPVFCNTTLSLEYQFHEGGCEFNNHVIGVGLTYKFGLFRRRM